jgi:CRISPR/Cas system CMR-associated protein Cmr5 small subunit
MVVKNGQHPAVSFFKNKKQLINRPASFAAQNENMKISNIMSMNAKYKVFYKLG